MWVPSICGHPQGVPLRRGDGGSAPHPPCVLVVADPARVRELADPFAEPLERGPIEVATSAGGDDTIDVFTEKVPHVVVVTASLELGDSKSLIEALRSMMPRAEVAVLPGVSHHTVPTEHAERLDRALRAHILGP